MLTRKIQILVTGHNENGSTPEAEKIAYETGLEIAKLGAVLITGGLGGVMHAACHGAKDGGGLTVGIIPQNDPSFANEYCDIVIPTGIGLARDFLNALAGDGVIIVGGGSGTLSATCAAYMYKKPIAAIKNSGGIAHKVSDQKLHTTNKINIAQPNDLTRSVKSNLPDIH